MEEIAYYDGKSGSPDEISVPFNDRSHFFGDGVYDATISGNHVIYCLEDHLDRFYSSAAALQINVPMKKQDLAKLLQDLDNQVDAKTHFVYWQVSRGVAPRDHAFGTGMQGKILIFIRPSPDVVPGMPEPVDTITAEDIRFEYCNIKTLNLLPSVMAYDKAVKAGAFEAILHRGDIVTECAHSNISILKDGVFYSHPNDQYILRGIGKTNLIKTCYQCSVPVIERPFTLEELFNADEVIITASSEFCYPVKSINGVEVGGKDRKTLELIGLQAQRDYLKAIGDI